MFYGLGYIIGNIMTMVTFLSTNKISRTKNSMCIRCHFYLGPALGSALYIHGGFTLPFISVGTFGLVIAIVLLFMVPDLQSDRDDSLIKDSTVLTMKGILTVGILLPYILIETVV